MPDVFKLILTPKVHRGTDNILQQVHLGRYHHVQHVVNIYTAAQTFGISKIFYVFLKKFLLLIEVIFVKYYCNLK